MDCVRDGTKSTVRQRSTYHNKCLPSEEIKSQSCVWLGTQAKSLNAQTKQVDSPLSATTLSVVGCTTFSVAPPESCITPVTQTLLGTEDRHDRMHSDYFPLLCPHPQPLILSSLSDVIRLSADHAASGKPCRMCKPCQPILTLDTQKHL
ncbi:hypothetical protein RRG08_049602 [Elysia crispata]|uniref:Uncharacterized protein n=1 Tax=Elysia crispata TaxID=231223 RepID=A0AAE1AWL3_9GAST|nr:hypothetical protein RRG08_049602 [Elysia crispata]